MAAKHETTLSYKLDARGLREARKEFERTFKPTTVVELNKAMKESSGIVKSLAGEQSRLNVEMLKVKQGTDQYKQLEKALKGVNGEMQKARQLQQSLVAAGASRPGAAAHVYSDQQAAPGSAGGGRGGFGSTFAGTAAGSYFGARAGAQRAGGLISGGGPLSTLFQGIPGLGGLAAMAEGNVERARAFDMARMQAFPFIGGRGGAGDIGGAVRAARAGVRIPGQLTGADESAIRGQGIAQLQRDRPGMGISKVGVSREEAQRTAVLRAHKRGDLTADQAYRIISRETSLGGESRIDIDTRQQLANEASGIMSDARATGGSLRKQANDRAGNRAVHDARGKRRDDISAAKGARGAAGRRAAEKALARTTRAFTDVGKRAGLDPTASLQMAGQLGRTTGGEFNPEMLEQALAGQMAGVDTSTTARMFRQQRPGRGGAGDINSLAQAMARATALGLEGSELNEHLGRIVSLQESAEQRGLKINAEGFDTIALGLQRGAGMAGPQAARVAGQFASFGQRVASGGVKGPVDVALLRNLGFRPGEGVTNYVTALERAEKLGEGGMDSKTMFGLISTMTGGMGDPRKSAEAMASQKLVVRRGLKQAGIDVSFAQAGKLASGVAEGPAGFDPSSIIEQARGETAEKFAAKQLGDPVAKALTNSARRQASLSAQLIAAGKRVGPTVDKINITAAKLSTNIGSLSGVVDKVMPMIEMISTSLGAFAEGGSLALVKLVDVAVGDPSPPEKPAGGG